MRITENKLRHLIKSLLIESLKSEDINLIKNVIDKLNFASKELINDLRKANREKDLFMHIVYKLDEVVIESSSSLDFLDEGTYRTAYSDHSQDWVLKLANSIEGAEANKHEIELSDGVHGLGARDIFIKVYDYDKINELPWWIICQKVIPLHDVDDIELLKSIFPTFWNILNSVTDKMNIYIAKSIMSDASKFIDFVTKMLIRSVITSQKVKKPTKDDKGWDYLYDKQKQTYHSKLSYKGLSKKIIYDVANDIFKGEILPIEEIIFDDDFKKLSKGLSSVGTTELHEGNIGIIKSSNPSPEDIVILDFDVES
tara:strand:+ start:1424 stop:2359 length:936 start_codon:yes stop_codon:yes gene_type:complete